MSETSETQVCDVRDCREPARYYDSESDAYRYCWRHALEAGLHYFPLNHSGDQTIRPSKIEVIVVGSRTPTRYLPCTEFVEHSDPGRMNE